MTTKKIIKYLFFLLLLIITGFVLKNKFINNNRGVSSELNEIIDQYEVIQKENDGVILEDFSLINEKKETLLISDLLETKKLIYRFSELHCDSCVINEFENLKKYINSEGKEIEDVIIISYYDNPRSLFLFKRMNELQDFIIYNLVNINMRNLKIDEMGTPYFFILDKDLKTSNTFVPIKEVNKRTDNYLKNTILNLKE